MYFIHSQIRLGLVCNEKVSEAAPGPRGGLSNGTNYILSTLYTRFDFGLFAQLCLLISGTGGLPLAPGWLNIFGGVRGNRTFFPPECWCNPFSFPDNWVMFAIGNCVLEMSWYLQSLMEKELFWSEGTKWALFFGWQCFRSSCLKLVYLRPWKRNY